MATLMPLCDEFVVWDYGSTDGTYEALKDLASKQPKLKLERHAQFPINHVTNRIDSGSFAEIPNAMIPTCKNDVVMYYQADEIWHENLVEMMAKRLEDLKDFKGLSFWRYQLRDNFQKIKWLPHIVHRVDYKDRFTFVDDGMNTNRTNDAELLSAYDGGWFTKWGEEFNKGESYPVDGNGNPYIYGEHKKYVDKGDYPYNMPTHEMILDISSIGGFLENIKRKRENHAPHWLETGDTISIGGIKVSTKDWYNEQKSNPDWTKTDTPFNIPDIMKPLLGKTTYPVRQELLDKIVNS
jgi:hypothetical protein